MKEIVLYDRNRAEFIRMLVKRYPSAALLWCVRMATHDIMSTAVSATHINSSLSSFAE